MKLSDDELKTIKEISDDCNPTVYVKESRKIIPKLLAHIEELKKENENISADHFILHVAHKALQTKCKRKDRMVDDILVMCFYGLEMGTNKRKVCLELIAKKAEKILEGKE